ncbi:DUF5320 domain-containing protein [Rhodobacter maris]|uniref:Transposase n=1 Tax=Rhodobacter maris TaxID=446682 RepID=A0A285SGM8_9RHOB|nr:DUF5320 domain-containing protein [Rhodobacter maris]SOC06921.1 hypothetical protein SAMN05877831_105179 [Rhodobacter maris]
MTGAAEAEIAALRAQNRFLIEEIEALRRQLADCRNEAVRLERLLIAAQDAAARTPR